MATKRAPRKRQESGKDITKEFSESYQKNFDCSSIQIKRMFPITDNQTTFYYLTQNDKTNMIFLDGPAGSSKSYISVYSALELLKNRKVDHIIYIRTVIESASRSMGAIPGEITDKFAAYAVVLIDKLKESTDTFTVHSLVEQEYVKAIPVNFVRGLTFNNSIVIVDEAQNATRSELTTILTRFGRNSKYIVCGDMKQSDISNSGFNNIYELFDTEFSRKNHIHCMRFDNSDINRSHILKHITQVLNV